MALTKFVILIKLDWIFASLYFSEVKLHLKIRWENNDLYEVVNKLDVCVKFIHLILLFVNRYAVLVCKLKSWLYISQKIFDICIDR